MSLLVRIAYRSSGKIFGGALYFKQWVVSQGSPHLKSLKGNRFYLDANNEHADTARMTTIFFTEIVVGGVVHSTPAPHVRGPPGAKCKQDGGWLQSMLRLRSAREPST